MLGPRRPLVSTSILIPRRLVAVALLTLWLLVGVVASLASTGYPGSFVPVEDAAAAVTKPVRGRTYGKVTRRNLSTAEQSAEMTVALTLRLPNRSELEARIQRGEVLSRTALESYLPTAADYAKARDWLLAQGFRIHLEPGTRHMIFVRGSVARVAAAFNVTMARVATIDGEFSSAISSPELPDQFATTVESIRGLQPHLIRHHHSLPLVADGYITPAAVAGAYQVPGGATGSGQTIAIIGDSGVATTDLTAFWSACGISQSLSNIAQVSVNGGTSAVNSDGIEAALDVEWASSIASAAQIRMYNTPHPMSSVDEAAAYALILSDLASYPSLHQVSESYAGTESAGDATNGDTSLVLLTALGVTCFSSSGDAGSNPYFNGSTYVYSASAPLAVNYPASDPYMTAVGGTLANFTSPNGIFTTPEVAWSGSGGGISMVFSRPSWQISPGVPAGSMRCIPDISAMAMGSAMNALVILGGTPSGIGGTSLSSPIWAGLCALINQSLGTPVGYLNPKLYAMAGTNSFTDITSGSNGAYPAGPGYDASTGLGTPRVANLIANLPTLLAPAITLNPVASQSVLVGQPVTFTAGASGTPTPSYQWQRLPSGGSTWLNLVNGSGISGSTSSSLTLTATTPNMTGDQYRCVATSALGSATTTASTLTLTFNTLVNTVTTPSAGTYGAIQILAFTVNFSGAVTVSTAGGTPYLTLILGSNHVQAQYYSGSGTASLVFRYTIQPGDLAASGIALGSQIVLNGGSINDGGGVAASPALAGVGSIAAVLVDGVPPVVTLILRSSPQAPATNSATTVWSVFFSKSVAGVSTNSFILTKTGTVTGTVSTVTGSGSVYQVTASSLAGVGSLRLDVPASGTGITDLPGNPLSGSFSSGDAFMLVGSTAVSSWGANGSGQLGNNANVDSTYPVSVLQSGVLTGKTVVAVANGYLHSLALTADGLVYAWGDNTYGELGNNSVTASKVPVAVYTAGALSSKRIVAIAAGYYYSLVLASDGTAYSWGNNGNGQLGNNSTTSSSVPVAVTTTGVLSGKTLVAIAAGGVHSLALANDGTAYAWGSNAYGQLGNNSTTQSLVPVAVNATNGTSALAGKRVVSVAAGQFHSLALASDGTVYAWGYNGWGQLGDSTQTQRIVPVSVSTAAGSSALAGKLVRNLAAGKYHSLAVATDGTAYAWGANSNGQLGSNDTVNSFSAIPVAVSLANGVSSLFGKSVVSVAAGVSHSLALASDGTVSTWGLNSNGQLGDNQSSVQQPQSAAPIAIYSSGTSPLNAASVYALGTGCYASHAVAVSSPPGITIQSVGVPSAGWYGIGASLHFSATFSGPVAVAGAPSLTLTLGSGVANATYISGSGTSLLVFSYTVQAGDSAPAGISIGASLSPNAGALIGTSGAPVVPTLVGVGTTTGVLVDGTAPTVVLGMPSNTSVSYGATVTIPVTFADANFSSSSLGFSSLTLNATGSANASLGLSGSGTSYTITLTNISGVGTLSVSVAPAQAFDLAGNSAPGSTSSNVTVHQSYANWQAQYGVGAPGAINAQDGLPNLVKYALGLPGTGNATTGLPSLTTDGTNWIYTYTKPAAVTDVTVAVEFSANLSSWSSAGVTLQRTATDGITETWQATYPVASSPNAFFRLNVSQ